MNYFKVREFSATFLKLAIWSQLLLVSVAKLNVPSAVPCNLGTVNYKLAWTVIKEEHSKSYYFQPKASRIACILVGSSVNTSLCIQNKEYKQKPAAEPAGHKVHSYWSIFAPFSQSAPFLFLFRKHDKMIPVRLQNFLNISEITPVIASGHMAIYN